MDIAEKELSKPSRKASVTKLQYLLDMSLRQPGSISSTDPFKDEVIVDMTHTSVTDYLLKIVNVSGMDPSEAMGLTGKDPNVVEKMFLAANRAESAQSASSDEKDKDRKAKHFIATMGLQLDFRIPFPLSLVLSRKTILRYQLLFRHLVELKHIERNLNNSWVEQAKSKVWRATSSNERLNEWKIKAVKLRVKMLLFVQQVL
jgi:gamma-tubulin complex component 2